MATRYKSLKLLIKYLNPHVWVGAGCVLFAAALLTRPHAGAPHVLWGKNASYIMAGWFIGGAVLVFRTRNMTDYSTRMIAYLLSLTPFLGYAYSVLWLFVVVRELGGNTTPLTTPLVYAGFLAFAIINFVLIAQLEMTIRHGVDRDD